jgi:hypothetical protein
MAAVLQVFGNTHKGRYAQYVSIMVVVILALSEL